LAETIYLNSKYKNNPLIIIDCSLISQQTWDYLLNKEESPLCDNGNTLYIKNIDALNDKQLRQLLAALIFGEVTRRNRLLISCSSTRGLSQITSVPVLKIINQLSCYVISMTPLNGQFGTIGKSVNLLLEDFRKRNNPNVGDISDDALALLLHYTWPQNYDQLIRVVSKAAAIALNGPISKEIVTEVLKTEMRFAQGETIHTNNTLLDLTKSLEEINCDIAHIILEQNGGNQSDAAKSLGISRTTLWRMLKNCTDLK
jgi:DNA-binding NtrC family response regulator